MDNNDEYADGRPAKRPRISLSEIRKSIEPHYNVAFRATADEDITMSDDIEDFSPPPTPTSRGAKRLPTIDSASQIPPQATSASQRQSMRPPASSLSWSTSSVSAGSTSTRPGPSNWRVLKPPSFPSGASSAEASARSKPHSMQSKPSQKLAPASSYASRLDFTSIGSKAKLSSSGKPLKLLPPPVLARKPAPPTRMTTISKTAVARTFDIHTEDGRDNLFSLWMLTHPTGYVDPETRELTRGLDQSPERKKKNKGVKFRRGGFAAQVSTLLGGKNTSFVLWHAAMERVKSRSQWDLRLFILSTEVILEPMHIGKYKSAVLKQQSVLVRGIVVLKTCSVHDVQEGDEITALFKLHDKTPYKLLPRQQLRLAENLEADISQPWNHIFLPRVQSTGVVKKELVACFERYRLFEIDDPQTYRETLKSRFPKGPRPFPMQLTQREASTSSAV
ncbi:hypothetical protein PsYK624_156260 [Phanerochaete sordida]|uniref:Uncharacterized protein n=1 Tax=Phanerochaete sordida TaxID=48140 RepID=A0A9P3LMH7_9APHY|nr:hypothetical protein PsYK624_156260 [Phanerochaete sordida]